MKDPKKSPKEKAKGVRNVKAEAQKKKQEMLMKKQEMLRKAKMKKTALKKKGTPKTGASKTGAPKTDYKYERIESKSEMPKFKLEKEKKVKMKKKDLKLKKQSPSKMKEKSPMNMSGRSYDMKMAYDKKLTPKARLHYLENERHDAPGKMKGSPYQKYGSPYHMGQKDSPNKFNKGLKQASTDGTLDNNPKFKAAVDASPAKMSNELKYGGPVIDQMKTLSQAGSSKVLKHMKSKI